MLHCKLKIEHPFSDDIAFVVNSFEGSTNFAKVEKLNYYSIIWIKKGTGKLTVDFYEYDFEENTMMFFSPYQPFMLAAEKELSGLSIHFHTDFFCLEKHKKEVSCEGVLFNNIYRPPFICLEQQSNVLFDGIIESIINEMEKGDEMARNELIASYLKIFLINASRIKVAQEPETLIEFSETNEPEVLRRFKEYIELYYRNKRLPSEYADLLNVTTKLLGKVTKKYFNKTTTELIQERIIIEAKRELYLTEKTIKEIAHALGFEDSYYFSRLFKNYTHISPQFYRNKITSGRLMANQVEK